MKNAKTIAATAVATATLSPTTLIEKALCNAGEFAQDMRRTGMLSESLKKSALFAMRHYPWPDPDLTRVLANSPGWPTGSVVEPVAKGGGK